MVDYEKKYKEALSRAATELETCGADKSLRNMIYAIFPDELKESEDEKIRKALVRFHKSTIDIDGIKGDDMKRVDKCCGGCTHFKYETTEGSGWCEVGDTKTYCGFGTDCNDFEDEETIRRERVARKEHESYGKSSCRNRR